MSFWKCSVGHESSFFNCLTDVLRTNTWDQKQLKEGKKKVFKLIKHTFSLSGHKQLSISST